jgi:hypothetical protein
MTRLSKTQQVNNFNPFPVNLYDGIDLAGLAAYTIMRLQELQIPATFENLVVALFRLFPAKFNLEGFNQYPDAARAGRTLLQLGPKYRNWARGSVQKGFTLTQSGLTKAGLVANILISGQPIENTPRRQAIPRTMDLSKELISLEDSTLFLKWKTGKLSQGEPRELFDLLGAYAYTPSRALRDRALFLENSAKQAGRADLRDFLQAVRRQFADLFRS